MSAPGAEVPPLRVMPIQAAPAVVDELVQWFESRWAPFYGSDGPGDARQDLLREAGDDGLPIRLVALGPDDRLLGTVALSNDALAGHEARSPWVSALMVSDEGRDCGAGVALLAASERAAAELGATKVYTSPDEVMVHALALDHGGADPYRMLESVGWTRIGASDTLRGPVEVLQLALEHRD